MGSRGVHESPEPAAEEEWTAAGTFPPWEANANVGKQHPTHLPIQRTRPQAAASEAAAPMVKTSPTPSPKQEGQGRDTRLHFAGTSNWPPLVNVTS